MGASPWTRRTVYICPRDKNLLEMYVKDGNIEIGEENPVLDNLIEFMKRQKVSDRHITPIGFAAQQAMKELRRANVSEERRAARWDRKGIEEALVLDLVKMNSLHFQQNLTLKKITSLASLQLLNGYKLKYKTTQI